jgi:hypothetical protein
MLQDAVSYLDGWLVGDDLQWTRSGGRRRWTGRHHAAVRITPPCWWARSCSSLEGGRCDVLACTVMRFWLEACLSQVLGGCGRACDNYRAISSSTTCICWTALTACVQVR